MAGAVSSGGGVWEDLVQVGIGLSVAVRGRGCERG